MSDLKTLNKSSPEINKDSPQTIKIGRLRERKSKSGTCVLQGLLLLDGLAEGQGSVSSEKGEIRFARRTAGQRRYCGFGSMCRLRRVLE